MRRTLCIVLGTRFQNPVRGSVRDPLREEKPRRTPLGTQTAEGGLGLGFCLLVYIGIIKGSSSVPILIFIALGKIRLRRPAKSSA